MLTKKKKLIIIKNMIIKKTLSASRELVQLFETAAPLQCTEFQAKKEKVKRKKNSQLVYKFLEHVQHHKTS